MPLDGEHEVGETGHVDDHNLIDDAIAALIAAVDALEALVPSAAVVKSTATTKGDLFAATASATIARLGAGANNTALIADSTQSAGLKYVPKAWFSSAQPYIPATGEFITPQTTATGTAGSYVTGNMYLEPIDIAVAKTFDRIGTNITATGTGSGQVIRLGIYNDDGTGSRPTGAAVLDAGTVDSTSGTGDKLITISQALNPGRYWLAWVIQGTVTTSPTVVTLSLVNQIGLTNLGNNSHRVWGQAGVSGALPTIGTLYRDMNPPIIGLRAA